MRGTFAALTAEQSTASEKMATSGETAAAAAPLPPEQAAGPETIRDAISTDDTIRVARFGSFLLVSPHPFPADRRELMEALVDALENDPRVIRAQMPEVEEAWFRPGQIYPSPADREALILGVDATYSLLFSHPLIFEVEVPAKNQPLLTEGDPVPTRYEVVWDGGLIVVAWQMQTGTRVPMSGGHVVQVVLRDALHRAGYHLYVQGCTPGCRHGFAHTDIRLSRSHPDGEKISYSPATWSGEVEARVPLHTGPDPAVLVHSDLRFPTLCFTALKNQGRRLLEIEEDARSSLDTLTTLSYQRSQLYLLSPHVRALRRWQLRGWRRDSRRLIARVWLGLATLERLRRQWSEWHFEFEAATDARGLKLLYAQDYADEVERVRSLDLGLIRGAVEHAAQRLDAGAMTRVTVVAALAGGIAGAVVGAIAGHL